MDGVGQSLQVFQDNLTLTPKGVIGLMKSGLTGSLTVPLRSISTISFKKSGFTNGFLSFNIVGGELARFEFADGLLNDLALQIKTFIEGQILAQQSQPSSPTASIADQLHQLGTMMREGLLSASEFEAAKRKLLV